MRIFGVAHVLWLLGIAVTSGGLAWIARRQIIPNLYLRAALAIFLVGGELQRYFHDGMRWPDALPLNLCNITTWVAVIACLCMSPLAVEFVYFAGIGGASMALLTPDMGAAWPPRFFINHGGLVVAASMLIFGRMAQLRPRAAVKSYAWFAAYVFSMAAFDRLFGVNYGYVRQKPSFSVLNFLGPWPFYILGGFAVAVVVFWLLGMVAPRGAAVEESLPANLDAMLEGEPSV